MVLKGLTGVPKHENHITCTNGPQRLTGVPKHFSENHITCTNGPQRVNWSSLRNITCTMVLKGLTGVPKHFSENHIILFLYRMLYTLNVNKANHSLFPHED